MDLIDLSTFLTEGTSAPSRALPALCWFSKHAALEWAVGDLVAPERTRGTEPGEHHSAPVHGDRVGVQDCPGPFPQRSDMDPCWEHGWSRSDAFALHTSNGHLFATCRRVQCIVGVVRASRRPRGQVLIGQSPTFAGGKSWADAWRTLSARSPPKGRSNVVWCSMT